MNYTKTAFEEGQVLLIDKPLEWTSFDVVQKLRGIIKIKKIGHAGTLDPLATGLLIVCTGKFTKKINEYMAQVKEYTGTFTLGATTPTYDLESEPRDAKPFEHITEAAIQKIIEQFTGEILQIPPAHSAIKVGGKRVYELARQGKEVKLEPRKVTVHVFEITAMALPVVHFRIVCSTGTYIRSMAHDVGQALQCGAYLSSLRRTKIGDFSADDAIPLSTLQEKVKAAYSING
ncbi:MAG: tRNA pseudouridine(55) synthase TruB [Bacteroidota bacterium]|jgi:tRNA pseudouridine55 synthase